ncbi:hypothetical protein BWR17_06200 [Phaeobacter inhibens]|nr:hypothetical protein BWR17_06200 [Phaeobacter inhibens]
MENSGQEDMAAAAAIGRPVSETFLWPALQTDLQGQTGAVLKSADDTHVQLMPSHCVCDLCLRLGN